MDIYERQDSLGLSKPSVAIVGCGGVGVWAAMAIALGGASEIELYDSDEVSIHNLNRLPFSIDEIGQPKVMALARLLNRLRPELEISCKANFNPELHKFSLGWVVCCTDSLKSRLMIYSYAKAIGCKYIELGADGERWTLAYEPPQFSTELELNPGYQTVPVHVGPCMMAGAAAAYYVLHDRVPVGDHIGLWDRDKLQVGYYGPTEEESDEQSQQETEVASEIDEQAADWTGTADSD